MRRSAIGQKMLPSTVSFERKPCMDGGRRIKEAYSRARDVSLVEGDVSKVTKVGAELDANLKTMIMEFLKQNLDIFT